MRLEGQVAAVTGAGQGIGRSIARTLAKEGAAVVVSDISAKAAYQVARDITDSGGTATSLKVDVTIPHEARSLTTRAVESFGALDILVNNAGVYPSAPILDITEEQWDFVLAVNLKGAFLCSQPAVSHMITRRKGAIVNISSGDAKMRTTGNAHYAAAKAGVISLTRTLACETAPYGIRVNAVAPGWIGTDTLLNASNRWKDAMEKIPVGRLGTPEDVAQAVLFLVSDVSSYITGEVLDVNGGLLMD